MEHIGSRVIVDLSILENFTLKSGAPSHHCLYPCIAERALTRCSIKAHKQTMYH